MSRGGGGPGYTVDDLIYYMGLFGGIIIGVLTLRQMGYQDTAVFGIRGIVPLLGGLALGVLLGFIVEQAWRQMKAGPRDPGDGPPGGPPRGPDARR